MTSSFLPDAFPVASPWPGSTVVGRKALKLVNSNKIFGDAYAEECYNAGMRPITYTTVAERNAFQSLCPSECWIGIAHYFIMNEITDCISNSPS